MGMDVISKKKLGIQVISKTITGMNVIIRILIDSIFRYRLDTIGRYFLG
jgi:hypothetical protein